MAKKSSDAESVELPEEPVVPIQEYKDLGKRLDSMESSFGFILTKVNQ